MKWNDMSVFFVMLHVARLWAVIIRLASLAKPWSAKAGSHPNVEVRLINEKYIQKTKETK